MYIINHNMSINVRNFYDYFIVINMKDSSIFVTIYIRIFFKYINILCIRRMFTYSFSIFSIHYLYILENVLAAPNLLVSAGWPAITRSLSINVHILVFMANSRLLLCLTIHEKDSDTPSAH